jgi:uncharacterized protein GlcG (DUF336 family)
MAMKMIAAAVAASRTAAASRRGGRSRGRCRIVVAATRPHHVQLAQRKAYTALTSRRTSADWAKATEPGTRIAGQRSMAKVVPLGGGVPIKVGDETIGAIGVSGSSTDPDETCAMAGLAGIADQLK